MLRIGLTGGIGSGKSEVTKRFAALGINIIDTDIIARDVVKPGTEGLQAIQQHFGDTILQSDGSLNRKVLRERIFNNTEERLWLERLLHPLIRQVVKKQIKQAQSPYVIIAIPLLLETKTTDYIDRVLVVDTPEEEQIKRIMQRDNTSQSEVKKMLATQVTREERLKAADDIINNNSTLEALDLQVETLHKQYLTL